MKWLPQLLYHLSGSTHRHYISADYISYAMLFFPMTIYDESLEKLICVCGKGIQQHFLSFSDHSFVRKLKSVRRCSGVDPEFKHRWRSDADFASVRYVIQLLSCTLILCYPPLYNRCLFQGRSLTELPVKIWLGTVSVSTLSLQLFITMIMRVFCLRPWKYQPIW